MKITKAKDVTSIGLVMSSLLLVFTASCSFEKQAEETSAGQQAKEDYYEKSSESFVANPFCLVCHLDFEEEELVLNHKLAGIGCERCHGESTRHRSDEANITPPEIMYSKARVNPTCMMCHPRGDIRDVKDHQPLLARVETVFDQDTEESVSGAAGGKEYCTDCHGQGHRIKVRTVRWNKATGELIED